ncbi:cupin-like domain-containing protein [Alkalimonas delamerensis]|uniref:Cupin-like domain-containing protein n=1 Tax=Alkalimonas delamerensis TaxID=265981 RepID=A0ABT9GKM9_9GAMM|nr:cupin-like domain-containing protein [Alkalimonas delamerensis]MDP4527524.1 cupin-like domain-containing protein [Alkalimonas delamerensis]
MTRAIRSWQAPTSEVFFNEIWPLQQPAVLKGLVANWPAVQQGLQSDGALGRYLHGFDNGHEVTTLLLAAETKGQIGYQPQLDGFNFERRHYPVSAIVAQLIQTQGQAQAVRIAAQSALVHQCLPGFEQDNVNPLLPSEVRPRIWLGNRVMVPAHFDDADNLACVVAGRRRFTLFPPEQIGNMYIGPLDYAPTGTPISLVNFSEPDLQRYPKATEALAHAQVAELEPGDALYIPALWWHQVESCSDLSLLCNYWWNGSIGNADNRGSPFAALLHSLLQLRQLPEAQKKSWQAVFLHYLNTGEAELTHIPKSKRGVLAEGSCPREQEIYRWLVNELQQYVNAQQGSG